MCILYICTCRNQMNYPYEKVGDWWTYKVDYTFRARPMSHNQFWRKTVVTTNARGRLLVSHHLSVVHVPGRLVRRRIRHNVHERIFGIIVEHVGLAAKLSTIICKQPIDHSNVRTAIEKRRRCSCSGTHLWNAAVFVERAQRCNNDYSVN